MRIKKSEQKHIIDLGGKWNRSYAAASLSVRQNSKLLGLDKIREAVATCAALKATGCPGRDGCVIPKEAGDPHQGIQEVVDVAFTAAVEAAHRAFQS